MNTFDEREGLPSSSKLDRLWACPGSERECEGVQEFRDPKLERWAQFGERVHYWLQLGDFVDLTSEEREVAEQCRDQRDELLATVFEGMSPTIVTETRYWLRDAKGRKRMSGKLDLGAYLDTTGFVLDYKSGRGQYDDAPANLQLRSNGVLFWIENRRILKKVTVALCQPLLGPPTVAEYTVGDLEKAEAQIHQILDAAEKPDAPLRPGPHCKYCPAKIKCKEARRVLGVVSNVSEQELPSKSADDISRLLDIAATAEPIIKAIRAHAKQMLKNGSTIPNWSLGKPSAVRSLQDPVAVWGRCHQLGLLDQSTFLSQCVSVGIGDLEAAIGSKNDLKPKAAKEMVNKDFSDLITTKPKEASLERA